MKKWMVPISFFAVFSASPAFASANSFEGISVGVNTNVIYTDIRSSGSWASDFSAGTFSEQAKSLRGDFGLQLQYNVTLDDNITLGLGAAMNSAKYSLGDFYGFQTGVMNSSSVFLAPGYVFNDKIQVYGKVAHVKASVDAALGRVGFGGTGLGFGVEYRLSKNWSLKGEYMSNRYNDHKIQEPPRLRAVEKLSSNVISVGAAYRF